MLRFRAGSKVWGCAIQASGFRVLGFRGSAFLGLTVREVQFRLGSYSLCCSRGVSGCSGAEKTSRLRLL